MRLGAAHSNGDRRIVGGDGTQAIGNSIRSNSGPGLVLGDYGGDHENALTSNKGGMETQIGVAGATDAIFNLGSNVCGTDSVCP